MALKDIWIDRVDGVDGASAEDINQVAHAVIENEDVISETTKNVVQNTEKINNIRHDYPLFSNAIKGSASGEIVSLDDVSPIAHEMAASVRKKNLCNVANITAIDSNPAGNIYLYDIKKHGTYTASADVTLYADDTATNPIFIVQVLYTDYTYSNGGYSSTVPNDGVTRRFASTVTTDSTKEIKYVRIIALNYSTQNGRHAKAENIQLEEGATATPYAPFIADISGVKITVSGENLEPITYGQNDVIKSIYPSMTLKTDTAGAIVDVTYNRDANKVVNELETRIAALESAILN